MDCEWKVAAQTDPSPCLLPQRTSAVVGVVIVSSSLDGHIGLLWTTGGKVKNLDFTTEGGCATLAP